MSKRLFGSHTNTYLLNQKSIPEISGEKSKTKSKRKGVSMRDKKRWKVCAAAGALAALTTVGGIMAYFTDLDEQTNTFTVGNITIDLQEPEWDEKPDEDGDDIPDEAEDMRPAQNITKDPQVQNTGVNEAFVFVTVETPYQELITVNPDGTKNPLQNTALYFYTVNNNWKYLGSTYEEDESGNYVSEKKLYAYAGDDGNCIALDPSDITNTLFDSVTLANVMEGQGIEDQTFHMPIQAYGIQTTDLNGGVTDAESVWQVVANQKEIADIYTE